MLIYGFIIGNIGRDGEMRYTPGGNAVTEFSVAANIGYGENKKIQWVSVNTWNKLAESANQYAKKGRLVFVQGRIEMQEWTKDGVHNSKLLMTADIVRYLDKMEVQQSYTESMLPPAEDDMPF